MSINAIFSRNDFRRTPLFFEFKKKPFGFVDIGSMEGVHAVVEPIAALTDAVCFEPNAEECAKLEDVYKDQDVYANVHVFPTALSDKKQAKRKIYVTRKATNCSFFKPSATFVKRYHAVQFEEKGAVTVTCDTLDHVLAKMPSFPAEFIKLDTQGSEYEILKGAVKTLEKKCLGVLCEVEFFEVYENQKTFSDVDKLLKSHGFCLYGLTPHYRSTKSLDRKKHDTQERMMWADAFYLKDPLDTSNHGKKFNERQVLSLILIAVLNGYHDVAHEWAQKLAKRGNAELLKFIETFSKADVKRAKQDVDNLHKICQMDPDGSLLHAMQFVSRHRKNTDVDYVAP